MVTLPYVLTRHTAPEREWIADRTGATTIFGPRPAFDRDRPNSPGSGRSGRRRFRPVHRLWEKRLAARPETHRTARKEGQTARLREKSRLTWCAATG